MSSSYRALYRKWRPMTFSDIVGQNHVSDTLKHGIAAGRITHAYLFCGTRGTGKTSTAKIFSRAVNCEHPIDGEPCNECPTCRGILDGSIMDVYEMDAASNRGVENIREIRDEVIYTPAGCTYKVYIIDEVHMLTQEAFNALLKTLEEPPAHALFILATTEPNKLPATVLSRCQRFDFRRISVLDIASRLRQIAEAEKIPASEDALELVAELGDGSMRDALSILDQCAAFEQEDLTAAKVSEIVGIADPKTLFSIVDAIADGDAQTALLGADALFQKGKEVQNFLEELSTHLRNLLICKSTAQPEQLLERSKETVQKYQNQAEGFSAERLIFMIKMLGEATARAKWMTAPRLAAEMALIQLANPKYSSENEALLARIEKLERMISGGVPAAAIQTAAQPNESAEKQKETKKETAAPAATDTPPWQEEEKPPKAPAHADAAAVENQTAAAERNADQGTAGAAAETASAWGFWADALQEIKEQSKSLFAFLYNAKAYQNGSVIELELNSQVAFGRIATPKGLSYLSKLFSGVCGSAVTVKAYMQGERPQPKNEKEEPETGILDIAKKKEMLGDRMTVIQNEEE